MSQPFKMRDVIFLPDLDERYPDHTWTFWASPTPAVLSALLFTRSSEDDMEREDAYVSAVSECVLDTGESKLDWSTPEKVRETFYSDEHDSALLGGIVAAYTERILDKRREHQKKMLERSNSTGTGTSKPQTAGASPT